MSEKPTAEEFCKVSDTIWEQLGGRRFGAMTGVKVYFREAEGSGAISFFLPRTRGFVKQGINHVRIVLNWKDLYDLTFSRLGKTAQIIEKRHDLYADELQTVFTEVTGLDTHL